VPPAPLPHRGPRQPGPGRPLVAVVGGGISGLTAAWRLATLPDPPRVVVLEGSPRVGGALRTGELDGVPVDLGAESFLARRPEAVDLARELGLADRLEHPAASAASVLRDAVLHPLPPRTVMGVPGGPEHLSGPLTAAEVERVLAEPGLPAAPLEHDVDVAGWVAARVGPAVVDRLVEPLLGGVYAGHASRLSLQATVPALWRAAREGGSVLAAVRRAATDGAGAGPVFAGLRGGVGRLPEELAAGLAERGVAVRTRAAVRGLHRTATGWRLVVGPVPREEVLEVDAVVLAVPPAAAARLLAAQAPAAARGLAGFAAASVALVTALVPREALGGAPGSGVLVPPAEGLDVKAMTFSSAKWAWTGDAAGAGRVAVRMSLGRAGEEAVLQRNDADLAELALAQASGIVGRPLTGGPGAPRTPWLVTRWGGALPQYAVGHVARVAAVRADVARLPGLAVCGAAYDGVGIPACVAAAGVAARQVADHLAGGADQGARTAPGSGTLDP